MSRYVVVCFAIALMMAACARPAASPPAPAGSDDAQPDAPRTTSPTPMPIGIDPKLVELTPEWARRRMFGRSSPAVHLIALDGADLDAHAMHGSKRLVVYWDHADRVEEAAAVSFMQVLQKAQADLEADGTRVAFAHAKYPSSPRAPLTADELRAWADRWSVVENGNKLPGLPLYQLSPDEAVLDNLGQSPTIVVLDARGVVRWHSEGLQEPPADALVVDPAQYTIIEAIGFALDKL